MGCFITCFGSSNSKHRKSKKPTTNYRNQNSFKRRPLKFEPPQHTKHAEAAVIQVSIKPCWESKRSFIDSVTKSIDQNLLKRPEFDSTKPTQAPNFQYFIKPVSESRESDEAQLSGSTEKKVIHLNVETNKKVETQEVDKYEVESEEKKKGREKGTTGNEEVETEKGANKGNRNQSQTFSDSSYSSMISYPPMHRYHGCTSSNDDYPDLGFFSSDFSADVNLLIPEESSGSLFSLSIESLKQVNRSEVDDKEVTSPLKSPRFSDKEMKSVDLTKQISRAEVDDKEVTSPLKSPGSSEKEIKSIDSSKQISRAEVDIEEVNIPLKFIDSPERKMKSIQLDLYPRAYARSMLNPVENTSQWKLVKARTSSSLSCDEKENANLEQEFNIPTSEEPCLKRLGHNSKQRASFMKPEDDEIAVDTSLSSWLAESEKTPVNKDSPSSVVDSSIEKVNSWRSFEDRPILGALTIKDVKHLSASSSPRRSPSRNHDMMPIIGTVGSCCSHTEKAMESSNSGSSLKGRSGRSRKLSEDDKKAARRHSTPLGIRLERALDRGTA